MAQSSKPKIRFGRLLRTSSSIPGDFVQIKAPLNFVADRVMRVIEGPYDALFEGKLIQVALLQYRVNEVLVADVWVDLDTISSEKVGRAV